MKGVICISDICPLSEDCKLNLQHKRQDKRKFIYTDFIYLVHQSGKGWQCKMREDNDK